MQRRFSRGVAAAGLGLVTACNLLTGVGDLTISDEADASTDATLTSMVDAPSIDAPNDPGERDAANDVVTSDAVADAIAPADAREEDVAPPPCTTVSVGPRYPKVALSPSGAPPNWSDVLGIRSPNDDDYAHSNGTTGEENPNPIHTSTYDFKLPNSAIIRGLKVELGRTANGNVTDDSVTLPKGKKAGGATWAPGPNDGPYPVQAYGGESDLWDATWSAADINASSFGVTLTTKGDGDGHADSIGITVWYCVPGT